jgi:hypothetical protein
MQNVVGIFPSAAAAEEAIEELLNSGMTEQSIIFLSGEAPGNTGADAQVDRLPTTDAEGDGMGKAMGAVMGGALGASAGLAGGAAVASLAVPGVGTIFAIGLGAAAALGLGGAAAGAKAGEATEHALDVGVPKDDVPLFHELLRRGRSLVIANVESEEQAATTRSVLKKQGSEDVDAARKELKKAA